MIPKLEKPPTEVKSYRPISLLPILSKLYEKILQVRIKQIIEQRNLVSKHRFSFRNAYSTIDQIHLITDIIEIALGKKNFCTTVFLDVSQSFDKVSHKGLVRN